MNVVAPANGFIVKMDEITYQFDTSLDIRFRNYVDSRKYSELIEPINKIWKEIAQRKQAIIGYAFASLLLVPIPLLIYKATRLQSEMKAAIAKTQEYIAKEVNPVLEPLGMQVRYIDKTERYLVANGDNGVTTQTRYLAYLEVICLPGAQTNLNQYNCLNSNTAQYAVPQTRAPMEYKGSPAIQGTTIPMATPVQSAVPTAPML